MPNPLAIDELSTRYGITIDLIYASKTTSLPYEIVGKVLKRAS
ncbi:MAG: hypothetical protein FD153_243 [Rhodospirillaceae bacterium]|nr:MAG: hypothetical protein FD153_243 [Rhodospirillaceae bacterium]